MVETFIDNPNEASSAQSLVQSVVTDETKEILEAQGTPVEPQREEKDESASLSVAQKAEEDAKKAAAEAAPKPVTEGEVKPGGEADTKKPVDKAKYTPDELENLLKTDAEVDTSRLSPEGILLMKSFQRGYDQKFKRLADEKKTVEEKKAEVKSPKVQLFERYTTDPAGVTREINTEIANLAEVAPGHADYAKAQRAIYQLQALKDEFRTVREQAIDQAKAQESIHQKAFLEVVEAIPDYAEKEPKLTEWAIKEMGLTMEDITYMSNPLKVGPRAVRFIKAVNAAYDRLNAGKTAESKKVVPAPLGRAGETEGGEKEAKEPSLEEMPYEEYKKVRMSKKS